MNVQEEHSKRVTFDTMDSIEPKIDKFPIMMGKLVTDDKGKTDNLNHESISPTEVEDRQDAVMNRADFRIGSGHIIDTEKDQGMDKTLKVGQDMILIIGVITEVT